MGRKCSAFMCSKTIEHGVRLFQFPKNYSHNWIFAVDRGPTWTPNTNSRLCSDHFPEVDYHTIYFYPKNWGEAIAVKFEIMDDRG